MKNQIKLQEQAISEIIKRYGEVIDLKKAPHLLPEIVNQYQELLSHGIKAAECLPPGGPPSRGEKVM